MSFSGLKYGLKCPANNEEDNYDDDVRDWIGLGSSGDWCLLSVPMLDNDAMVSDVLQTRPGTIEDNGNG